jgi:hypothetical protein
MKRFVKSFVPCLLFATSLVVAAPQIGNSIPSYMGQTMYGESCSLKGKEEKCILFFPKTAVFASTPDFDAIKDAIQKVLWNDKMRTSKYPLLIAHIPSVKSSFVIVSASESIDSWRNLQGYVNVVKDEFGSIAKSLNVSANGLDCYAVVLNSKNSIKGVVVFHMFDGKCLVTSADFKKDKQKTSAHFDEQGNLVSVTHSGKPYKKHFHLLEFMNI